MKGNKGITLIALVITIIVLLILAGVSIAMLTGENSILRRGSQASAENQLGAAQDAISLLVTEKVTEFYEKSYVEGTDAEKLAVAQAGLNAYLQRTSANGGIQSSDCITAVDNSNIQTVTCDWTGISATGKEADRTSEGDVFTLIITDNTKIYTSTGHYKNGKVTWKITTADKTNS